MHKVKPPALYKYLFREVINVDIFDFFDQERFLTVFSFNGKLAGCNG